MDRNAEGPRTGSLPDGEGRSRAVAEAVASVLRRRILDGVLEDGDTLPKQDVLLAEFRVGRTTLRQAMRILETEGLVTVRRGKIGGAVVHAPRPQDAAYMFGMVMHKRRVPLEDLSLALRSLEPVCVGLCARRPDRDRAVLPELEAVHDEMVRHLDDGAVYVRATRRFHEAIVRTCGNQTMQILLSAIEELWGRQEALWMSKGLRETGRTTRLAGALEHAQLIELIAAGDEVGAYRLAVRHLEGAHAFPLSTHGSHPVEAGERTSADKGTASAF
ncbi:GntR family transcriptional regulator [Yinghuangia aomiensis]|uniref:GntR family transcriptional regulator n=1 Tax=Yinghuangia aomiensis TaxID=676205 RepID=A0ABP9I8I3_9ACTN